MKIESSAFAPGEIIPESHSRFGDNLSPALAFHDVPDEARSLALIVDDPDAPRGTFTHWLAFNLPPGTTLLPEGAAIAPASQGKNDWGERVYGGPKPPSGEHRYFFRLFAVDRRLDLPPGSTRAEVDHALRGHVVSEASVMGRFAAPLAAHH